MQNDLTASTCCSDALQALQQGGRWTFGLLTNIFEHSSRFLDLLAKYRIGLPFKDLLVLVEGPEKLGASERLARVHVQVVEGVKVDKALVVKDSFGLEALDPSGKRSGGSDALASGSKKVAPIPSER